MGFEIVIALFTIAKIWNLGQMPIDDRLDKEYVAHIHHGMLCSYKNDEFVSFVGTWMNLEAIILSKLTQEQNIKHCMFSLIGGCWTSRTCGHREGSITHRGPLRGVRGGIVGGMVERDNMGRNVRYRWWGDEGSKSHCHVCTYATILHALHIYPKT